ncbi:hypothetical protein BKA80DRAFT_100890 [Phyllosticta citrichinensis]
MIVFGASFFLACVRGRQHSASSLFLFYSFPFPFLLFQQYGRAAGCAVAPGLLACSVRARVVRVAIYHCRLIQLGWVVGLLD